VEDEDEDKEEEEEEEDKEEEVEAAAFCRLLRRSSESCFLAGAAIPGSWSLARFCPFFIAIDISSEDA
jgi:hypothetical protein